MKSVEEWAELLPSRPGATDSVVMGPRVVDLRRDDGTVEHGVRLPDGPIQLYGYTAMRYTRVTEPPTVEADEFDVVVASLVELRDGIKRTRMDTARKLDRAEAILRDIVNQREPTCDHRKVAYEYFTSQEAGP